MKQYILYGLCLLTVFISSCDEDGGHLMSFGTLRLQVDKNEVTLTKASSPVTDQSLKVYIINAKEDTIKAYNDYLSDVQNEKLILPVGTYTVAVSSNQTEEAGWEKPFYAGQETVEVKAGEITNATVTCKIANAKVTIAYSEGVKTNFTNYETRVSNSSGWLLYTRDEYRSGYFTPEKLVADLSLTNNDGKTFSIRRVFADIKPRYHYTITFKVGEKPENPEGGNDFNITVDEDAQTVECQIVIDEDDLEGKKVPVLKLSDSFNNNQLTLKEGDVLPPSSLTIHSLVGIEMLTVKAESDLFQAAGVASFDLTKLEASAITQLDVLGFPLLPTGQDMKRITLDFNKLAANLLLDVASVKTKKTHKFTVYAMDTLHQETTITFTYEARPNVAVSTNEPNAFSTFAFLYGESAEALGHAFKYRKQGETEYKTIVARKVNADGTFDAIITGLKPGTLYEYIAIAGGEGTEGDLKTFTTESALPLPGGRFEEWSGNNPANSFWSSGNNSFVKDLLSPTDIIVQTIENNKKAANLQSKKVPIVDFGAGNLFTGNFEIIGTKGGKITLGRSFESKPSKLKGYYNYTPGNINQSGTITIPSGTRIDVQNGKTDTCSIYIALSKEIFTVNTTKPETLFDMNMPQFKERIVAYAELPSQEALSTGGKYKPFELTLKYTQPHYAGPLYLVIVCSASKYGDYFKGGTGSNLKLDEFELIYDYDEKCFNAE